MKILKKQAFTLLEVLISLAISSFIIVGMFRIYMNSVSYVDKARDQMLFNRKVYLFFDQFEKDLSSAFDAFLYGEEKVESKEDDKKEKDPKKQPPKKEKAETKIKHINSFITNIYEGETKKIKDSKWELFKSVNFITTNPLQIYGQKRVRLVRVMYELVKDKSKSTQENPSYILIRKETEDLSNEKLTEPEDVKEHSVRKQVVADNIKGLYLKYMSIKDIDKKQTTSLSPEKAEKELVTAFVWDKKGDKKDGSQALPAFILLKIIFWNENLSYEYSFDNVIQIFSISTPPEEEKKPKIDEKKSKDDERKSASVFSGNDELKKIKIKINGQ
jgi:prepilin-type N-terminal cleavage/methylation domain-containing protein